MNNFLTYVADTLNSGDPEVRTWFLVRHNYLPFILCGFYVMFSTLIGPAIMKERKPFNLRLLMVVYNFSLVVNYTICLIIILWNLLYINPRQFCSEHRLKNDNEEYLILRLFWIMYIMKYIEHLDTVFFVLRKKQKSITSHHVIHHSIVPIVYWILFRTEKSGTIGTPVVLNTIEHIVMYTYYGLAAVGPRVKKYLWWKKYVTHIHIIHLILVVIFLVIVAPLIGCALGPAIPLIVFFCLLLLCIFLFASS